MLAADGGYATLDQYARICADTVVSGRLEIAAYVPAWVACRQAGLPFEDYVACAELMPPVFPPDELLPAKVLTCIRTYLDKATEDPEGPGAPPRRSPAFAHWATRRASCAAEFLFWGGRHAEHLRHSFWRQATDGRWQLTEGVLDACRRLKVESDTGWRMWMDMAYDLERRGATVTKSGPEKRFIDIVRAAIDLCRDDDGRAPAWSYQVRFGQEQ